MARRTRKAAVDAKMYRHFAVVTVCLTAALAIFADGENRKAVAEGIEAHERQTALERAEVAKFGQDNPQGRAAEADEIAPAFVYLASEDSRFVTGQVIHVNGGSYYG